MVKRLAALALTIILIFTISGGSVFAADNTYYLDELGLQVTIPTEYCVITRDTPDNDQIFSDLGIARAEFVSELESKNIYLSAIPDAYNEEIVVTMIESAINNFSLVSDTDLDILASTLETQYADRGISILKYDIYQHSQAKFIRIYFTDTDETVHALQYYTIYDGKAMNFTMRSYEGSISSRQEAAMKTIVDSIQYDEAPPVAEKGEDTDPFLHTDTDSGVTFTVPANWKQEPFTEDWEFIDVQFLSTKEDGGTIFYGSMDIWEQLSESERAGYTRSDLSNSGVTKSDVARMCDTTSNKITTVTYNGVQYFKYEAKGTTNIYGFDVTVTMTQLLHFDNGWVYSFQFGGASTHKLYSDFESLLESVQYPVTSNEDMNSGLNNNDGGYLGGIVAIVLLAVVVIMVIAVVAFFRKNPTSAAPVNDTPVNNTPIPKQLMYCRYCGQELQPDSVSCNFCGTEVQSDSVLSNNCSTEYSKKNHTIMKVFIWIGCIFVATLLNTLLGDIIGIKAGYMVFYFVVCFVAKKLCDKWDEYKEAKEKEKN